MFIGIPFAVIPGSHIGDVFCVIWHKHDNFTRRLYEIGEIAVGVSHQWRCLHVPPYYAGPAYYLVIFRYHLNFYRRNLV